jgi:hypothetical protein
LAELVQNVPGFVHFAFKPWHTVHLRQYNQKLSNAIKFHTRKVAADVAQGCNTHACMLHMLHNDRPWRRCPTAPKVLSEGI